MGNVIVVEAVCVIRAWTMMLVRRGDDGEPNFNQRLCSDECTHATEDGARACMAAQASVYDATKRLEFRMYMAGEKVAFSLIPRPEQVAPPEPDLIRLEKRRERERLLAASEEVQPSVTEQPSEERVAQ
jgi:hypothetical protein